MARLRFGAFQVWHTEKRQSVDGKDHWSVMRRDRPTEEERRIGVSTRWELAAGPFDTLQEAEKAKEELERSK